METKLVAGGAEVTSPADADIDRALGVERDNDWYVTLNRGEDDSIEVMMDAGRLWVEASLGDDFLQARSYVDDATVREMLIDFRDGGQRWRDLAAWAAPKPQRTHRPTAVLASGAAAGGVFAALMAVGIATGDGGWIGVAFALLVPAVLVIAAMVKLAQVSRAASWTRVNARILRSGMVTENRYDKQVKVPRVEYEYTAGFHRFRNDRVSLAEIVPGLQAKATIERYRVGASVPAYVNPEDPLEAVLERDLPKAFGAIWAVAGALFAAIVLAAWWFLLR